MAAAYVSFYKSVAFIWMQQVFLEITDIEI